MSEYLIILILGIVQGLTEFLPVSSDGHLELAKYFLGDHSSAVDSLQLTVILHMATALSILFVFRTRILELIKGLFNPADKTSKTFSTHILISMIPAAIVGLFFEKQVSELFNGKIMFVACMILTNGLILMLGHYRTLATGSNSIWKSFLIGISQAVAILPGISRSGSTIATASLTNFERNEAISFSFLMVVPLILGKIAKDIMEGGMMVSSYSLSAVLLGFVTAFVTGVLACGWMLTLVRNTKMNYFAWYCIVLGAGLIIYLLLNR